jgi:carbonic anhydrase
MTDMTKLRFSVLATLALALLLLACNSNNPKDKQIPPQMVNATREPLVRHIMTAESQNALTPDQVLQDFKDGNKRFQNNNLTSRDHSSRERMSALGQYPIAVVLSCIDSRIPIEDVLDQGLGDVFVGRVAGNTVDEDMLGSMEFACKISGAKLILVVGHQHCGAIKGAIDDVKLGNITAMLARIKPAIKMSKNFQGNKTSKNDSFVRVVAENNVRNTINTIRKKSPILRDMETKGTIKMAGVYYNLANGELDFID